MVDEDIKIMRQRLKEAKDKIERLNTLRSNESVKEYLKLRGLQEPESFTVDEEKIVDQVTRYPRISKDFNIYVCTGAFYQVDIGAYQDRDIVERKCSLNDSRLQYRTYKNIETGATVTAYASTEYVPTYLKYRNKFKLIRDFEKKAIVLNPAFDSGDNGYEKVKREFFNEALQHGSEKAKKLILRRYARVRPYRNK